ncbi:hypothetical protein DBR40_13495 [Pedobacter sp. KBW01]|uniref:hypothetical protein n=1 Tax=Pedobacter sp. KBW01 TaxID=2153364 RepID=UPI000F5A9845|nr:hypothetical protein [Pedobacter sp. KBW01]RQO73814.1 hypothetical protein DBR40_13495 [Pedobacter sp. KBW01]
MKTYIFNILLALSFAAKGQSNTVNYKYLIVPEKFSFLKQPNQYNLNTLAKALFEDKGFTVYYDNTEIPSEIATDRCKALVIDVEEHNSMFVTNLTFVLKDCKGNVVLKSKEGKSREKEYKQSYNAAMRDAFSSFGDIHYEAGSTPAANFTVTTTPAPEVKTVAPTPVTQPAVATTKQSEALLYAHPINNGYQLIDSAPKIVLTLLKTTVADYYIASNTSTNGVVLKKDGNWFFEYYKDNALVSEKLSIKF